MVHEASREPFCWPMQAARTASAFSNAVTLSNLPFCEQVVDHCRLLGRRQEIGNVVVVGSCHLAFDPSFNNQLHFLSLQAPSSAQSQASDRWNRSACSASRSHPRLPGCCDSLPPNTWFFSLLPWFLNSLLFVARQLCLVCLRTGKSHHGTMWSRIGSRCAQPASHMI